MRNQRCRNGHIVSVRHGRSFLRGCPERHNRPSTLITSTANSCPLDHRTTTSKIAIRCSFGSVTVNESLVAWEDPRETQSVQREIPDGALSLERTSVVRDRTLHWEAMAGANREGHVRLARWRILGSLRTKAQGPDGEMDQES